MSSRVLVIDCSISGLSGDMMISALLDLGANPKKVLTAIDAVKNYLTGCTYIKSSIEDVYRQGFRAKQLIIDMRDNARERSGAELKKAIEGCVRDLGLSRDAQKYALNVIDLIISTESRLHGEHVSKVHLHEVGSADTVADIVGSAVALEDLGVFDNMEIYSTRIAVGGDSINFSHGKVSAPAPATLDIIKRSGLNMVGGPVEGELTTPTGAAILASLTKSSLQFYPNMKVEAVGYGAGARDFLKVPNILRNVLGKRREQSTSDEIYVIDSNLDDVSGEIIAYAVEKLFIEGAKDVNVIPSIGKKGRPSQIVQVIADKDDLQHLTEVLMSETGSIGVRFYPCNRHILRRNIVSLAVKIGSIKRNVRIKISYDNSGKILQIKPEYDDLKRLSEKSNMPLREVRDLVLKEAENIKSK